MSPQPQPQFIDDAAPAAPQFIDDHGSDDWQAQVKPVKTFNGMNSVQRPDGGIYFGPEQGNKGKAGWFDAKGNRMNDTNGLPAPMGYGEAALSGLKRAGLSIAQGVSQATMGHLVPEAQTNPQSPLYAGNQLVAQRQATDQARLDQGGYGPKILSNVTEQAPVLAAAALSDQPELMGEVAPGYAGLVKAPLMSRAATMAVGTAPAVAAVTPGSPDERAAAVASNTLATPVAQGLGELVAGGLGSGLNRAANFVEQHNPLSATKELLQRAANTKFADLDEVMSAAAKPGPRQAAAKLWLERYGQLGGEDGASMAQGSLKKGAILTGLQSDANFARLNDMVNKAGIRPDPKPTIDIIKGIIEKETNPETQSLMPDANRAGLIADLKQLAENLGKTKSGEAEAPRKLIRVYHGGANVPTEDLQPGSFWTENKGMAQSYADEYAGRIAGVDVNAPKITPEQFEQLAEKHGVMLPTSKENPGWKFSNQISRLSGEKGGVSGNDIQKWYNLQDPDRMIPDPKYPGHFSQNPDWVPTKLPTKFLKEVSDTQKAAPAPEIPSSKLHTAYLDTPKIAEDDDIADAAIEVHKRHGIPLFRSDEGDRYGGVELTGHDPDSEVGRGFDSDIYGGPTWKMISPAGPGIGGQAGSNPFHVEIRQELLDRGFHAARMADSAVDGNVHAPSIVPLAPGSVHLPNGTGPQYPQGLKGKNPLYVPPTPQLGPSYQNIGATASTVGDTLSKYFKGENGVMGKQGSDYLTAVKQSLRTSLTDAAEQSGNPEIAAASKHANKFYSEFSGTFKDPAIVAAMSPNATPDQIHDALITAGKTRAQKLWDAMDPKGRLAYMAEMSDHAIEAMNKADGDPTKFVAAVKAQSRAAGVFLQGPEASRINGINTLITSINNFSKVTTPAAGIAGGASLGVPGMVGGAMAGFGGGMAGGNRISAQTLKFLLTSPESEAFLRKLATMSPSSPGTGQFIRATLPTLLRPKPLPAGANNE